jgi:hypothetical protein
MNHAAPVKRKLPFLIAKDSAEFQRALNLALIREIEARRTKHIPVENLQVFSHGRGWNFQRMEKQGFRPHTGQMELHSVNIAIGADRVRTHDPTVVPEFIQKLADSFEDRFMQELLKEMGTVAQESGNTVTIPKSGMTGEAFLEMVRRVEVHVGSDGKVSRPSLFLAPDMIEKIKYDLDQLGEEFKAKVEALWAEKEKEALLRESQRVAKFHNIE